MRQECVDYLDNIVRPFLRGSLRRDVKHTPGCATDPQPTSVALENRTVIRLVQPNQHI